VSACATRSADDPAGGPIRLKDGFALSFDLFHTDLTQEMNP